MQKWLQIAKTLNVGWNKHVVCPFCSKKDDRPSASINNNIGTWSIYCHKCKTAKVEDKGVLSLADIAAQRRALELANQPLKLSMPVTASFDFSPEGREWLQAAGTSDAIARKYGICYNHETLGVVLPCYKVMNGAAALSWIQERGVVEGAPKYRQPHAAKQGTWNNKPWGLSKVAVVTEDIISSVRISNATSDKINSHALMGTTINDSQTVLLMNYDIVILWLDDDKAGIDAVRAIRPVLSKFTKVLVLRTPHDPKKYSNREIVKLISDTLSR